MEGRLPNTRRFIRTNRNVLRAHKLARHLSNDDEHYLSHRGRPRMAIRIHGRHRYPHQTRGKRNGTTTPGTSPTLHSPHAPQIRTKRPIPKTRKMRLRKEGNRLSWGHRWQWSNTNGPQET